MDALKRQACCISKAQRSNTEQMGKGWRQGFSQWDDGSQLVVWPLRVPELS